MRRQEVHGRWQPTVPAWLGEPTYILHVIILKSNVLCV